MKLKILLSLTLSVAITLFAACTSETDDTKSAEPQAVTDTVIIDGMQFTPQTMTVHQGDTIVWINNDLVAHNITNDANREQASGDLQTGDSWRLVPEHSFSYLCTIHPTMTGSVTVQP